MEESGPYIDSMLGLSNALVTTKLSDPHGMQLELLYFHSHPDTPQTNVTPYSIGFTHLALTVSDLPSLVDTLTKEGLFLAPLQYSPDGRVLVTYGKGPENIYLELVEVLNHDISKIQLSICCIQRS